MMRMIINRSMLIVLLVGCSSHQYVPANFDADIKAHPIEEDVYVVNYMRYQMVDEHGPGFMVDEHGPGFKAVRNAITQVDSIEGKIAIWEKALSDATQNTCRKKD